MAPSISPTPSAAAHIQAVRGFNRFYTQRIGVLDPYLGSEFSLTEVRVLYELAHRNQPTASELGRDLALDAGYLSRILRRFESQGWLARVPSIADARQSLLALTKAGHQVFAPLQQQSSDEAAALLAVLGAGDRQKLVSAMGTVQRLLAPAIEPAPTRTIVLRDPQPGDMGWVVQQHGEIYAREYGWTASSKPWWPTSSASTLKTSSRMQRNAGWQNLTASGSARCSWCANQPRWPNCAC